jgi:PAS domain S-box-containing protein
MYGYPAAEAIGKHISLIAPPEMPNDIPTIMATLRRGEKIEHYETRRITKDGRRIDVSLTVSPLRSSKGELIGASAIARDITDRKEAEEALRVSDRLATLGRLAAAVTHEINNPLEALTNLLFLVQNEAQVPAKARQYLQMANDEVERMGFIVRQTLSFSRAEVKPSPVKLSGIVESVLTLLKPRIRDGRIFLRTEIKADDEIFAVPADLRQVFANIIRNAIEATPPAGAVVIRLNQAQNWTDAGERGMRITVADSGCGIPEHMKKHLFEPFFSTKLEKGTGLGLWVAHGIVQKHGGRIQVHSSSKDGRSGTCFSVYLPGTMAQSGFQNAA